MKHKVRHIHFVGIGGSGMSGIAEVLINLGYQVSGSDLAANAATRRLESLGARLNYAHAAENVAGADAVVVSTAVRADNPELIAARSRRVPVVPRALMLAELMRLKQGIAIAGTHGKTTTTSLIASVLAEGGLDPTFVIGGRLNSAASNARLGAGDFIVAEADESDASFLHLQPVMAVVTNIDADHMDTYQHDFARLKQAFVQFLQNLPFYGSAVLCVDDANVREIQPFVSKPVVTYGMREDAMVRAVDIEHAAGTMRFRVQREKATPLAVTAEPAGHAQRAERPGGDCGGDRTRRRVMRRSRRRWPNSAASGGASSATAKLPVRLAGSFTLVDDYGHHPAEMAATLAAARGAFPGRRIVLAFQPHRYTRTRDLFEDFVKVIGQADAVLLAEVYPAGEAPIVAADGRSLARAVRVAGQVEPLFVEEIAQMPEAIRRAARDGDVVVTMGAGSIGGVPSQFAAGDA